MKKIVTVFWVVTVGFIMILGAPALYAETSRLVSLLTDQLGVTNPQAEGGSGSLLRYAKQKLSSDDFSKVTGAIPETESLIKAAPMVEGLSDKLGSASSLLGVGKKTGSLADMAVLTNSFSSLGLDSGMMGKFVPIILEYAQNKGGDAVSSILKSVLP